MTRLLLPWIGLAILQLGSPRVTGAAELIRAAGETTSVAPRADTSAKDLLTRDRSRAEAVRVAQDTHASPSTASGLAPATVGGTTQTEAPRDLGPASLPHVLPDARAPPA